MKLDWVKENLKRLFEKDQRKLLLELLFYPLIIFATDIYRILESLISLKTLKKGQRETYCFSIRTGLSYLFYDTQALNFEYFGRKGTSSYLGFGDYPMSRWFSYSKFALILGRRAKPILVPVCMVVWLATHLIWLNETSPIPILIGILLLLLSSTFFHQTFTAQNYNVLGWLFFPIGIYGLLTGNLYLTAAAWFFSAFFSITSLAIAGIFTTGFMLGYQTWSPILTLLPAISVILVQVINSFDFSNLRENITNVLHRIGVSEHKNSYRRTTSKGLQTGIFYFFAFLIFLNVVFYYQTQTVSWIGITAFTVMILNTFFFRFADTQSIQMMLLTTGFLISLNNPSPLQFLAFWLLISPPAFIFYGTQKQRDYVIMPERKLKSIKPLFTAMENFLSPVAADEKVFFAFNDPQGIYENIFDGYRWLIELPAYIATKNKFLLLPNWWTVFESMTQAVPNFWGRSVSQVKRHLDELHADYAIVYQEDEDELSTDWEANGFRLLKTLSWKDYNHFLASDKVILKEPPVWFLLKKEF